MAGHGAALTSDISCVVIFTFSISASSGGLKASYSGKRVNLYNAHTTTGASPAPCCCCVSRAAAPACIAAVAAILSLRRPPLWFEAPEAGVPLLSQ